MILKQKIISGTIWTVLSQIMSLGLVLVTNIILVRLLSPSDFGKVGIVMTFIMLANIFTNGGLPAALVRQKVNKNIDFSTVFVFNLFFSATIVVLLMLCSGFIANYYRDKELRYLLFAACSVILISSFQTIQNVRLVIDMKFKEKSISMFTSSVVGVIAGVVLAYFFKAGVWSLIAIPIVTNCILVLMYWYYDKPFFSLAFSKDSFKNLYSFGVNTTTVSILNVLFDNIYQLILGRVFSLNQVGFFYQAKKLQDVPTALVNNLSQGVIYSALAKVQDDKIILMKMYNTMISVFTTFLGFTTLVMFCFAEDIVSLLFGKEWSESSFYLKMLSIVSFFYSQELINKVMFKVYNKTQILLKLEVVKKVIHLITLILGVYFHSIELLLTGYIVTSIISYILNFRFTQLVTAHRSNFEQIIVLKVVFIVTTSVLVNYVLEMYVNNLILLILSSILVYSVQIIMFRVVNIEQVNRLVKSLKT